MLGSLTQIRLATALAAAWIATLVASSAAAGPWESRFLDEVLTPGPTRWTPAFDAYKPDYYAVDKIALARALPDRAKQRGRNLRALIIVGPTGGLWTYYVIAVLEEGKRLRVNEIVMPHARITAKRSGVVERAEGDRIIQGIVDSRVLIPVRSLDDLAHRLDVQERIDWQLRKENWKWRTLGDFRFDLLVGVHGDKGASLWYSKLDTSDKAAGDAAVSAINALVRRTHATYEHGQGSAARSRDRSTRKAGAVSPPRGRIYLLGVLAHDPQPGLANAFASLGYLAPDTTQPALGVGGGVAALRARLALDIVGGTDRALVGPQGPSGDLSRSAFILTAGYDVWDEGQVAVYPFVGVGESLTSVRLDSGSVGPFPGSASRSAGEQRYSARQTAWLLGVGLEHVIPFAPRTERHRGGFDLGLRLGVLRGSETTRWKDSGENQSDDAAIDGPSVRLGGVFGMLELGFGDLR